MHRKALCTTPRAHEGLGRSKAPRLLRGDDRASWADRSARAKALWPQGGEKPGFLGAKSEPVWLEQKNAPWGQGWGLWSVGPWTQAQARPGVGGQGRPWSLWTSLLPDT